MNFYNEIDPYAAQWLRNLIAGGAISPGVVDERDIRDIRPDELVGFRQCHFFAGIGVWSYALRLAGWSDNETVWTASCPCQPFSAAGRGNGFADERHLWPAFFHLVSQCKPSIIFGEQVASKVAEPWIDLLHADLEGLGYAFGCVPFPSAGVGAPHARDRAYWLGVALGDAKQPGLEGYGRNGNNWCKPGRHHKDQDGPTGPSSSIVCVADSNGTRSAPWLPEPFQWQKGNTGIADDGSSECSREQAAFAATRAGTVNGFWSDADWLGCRDGRWRPVEPGTFPLVNGITQRVGRLRAYGNAINAQAAAEFIRAFSETCG